MKKCNKVLLFIISNLLISHTAFSDLKELRLVEDYSREVLNKPKVKKDTKENKKENKKEIKKEEINNIKADDTKIETINNDKEISNNVSLKDIVDVYEKRVDGKLVYRGDSTVPFTGIFGYVSLDKVQFYESYVNGLLDGETVWFSDKGVKMVSEFYKKSKLHGEQRTYFENGRLKSIVKYDEGRVTAVVCYDRNGKEKYKANFKDGTGHWKYFWSNGNLFEEGNYVNYKKDGVWKKYTPKGNIDSIYEYKNGRIVKQQWN